MLPQWVVDFLDRIENSSAMGLSRIDPYVVIKLKPWKDIRAQTKPMVRARSNFLYNRVHDNIIELDVPNTFPNTARRTAHIRLELWDKDAMVDDLMGIVDIDLTSADGLRLCNLGGTAHEHEVKLPATDHADNHGATAVVTLRMTLVAQEPAESPHLPPQQPNPALSSQVSVRRRMVSPSSSSQSARDDLAGRLDEEGDVGAQSEASLSVASVSVESAVNKRGVRVPCELLNSQIVVEVIGVSQMTFSKDRTVYGANAFVDNFVTMVCLAALLLYMFVGVTFYTTMEGWSVLDSIYFCVTTVATVGYGDVVPSRDASKLFTSFFAVLGVVIMGSALAHVVMEFFEGENIVVMKFMKMTAQYRQKFVENRAGLASKSPWKTVAKVLGCYFAQVLLAAAFYQHVENMRFIDAFYMVNITMMTVGYGDFSPRSKEGRVFAIFNILIAYSFLARFGGYFMKMLMAQRYNKLLAQMMDVNTGLQPRDLAEWDVDGDDMVTEIEFVRGVLMKMGKVQVHEFDQIREQFKKFDADNSGAISKEEIIQRSTTKLERPTGVSPWPGEESNDLLGSMARRIPEISLT